MTGKPAPSSATCRAPASIPSTRKCRGTLTARWTSTSVRGRPGKEANWIQTASGGGWFPFFRFYGPEKSLFEKTWKLPDIEKVQ